MPVKIFAGVIAATLLLGYLGAIAFKMKDVALTAVILVGAVMMLVDLWQSLTGKED